MKKGIPKIMHFIVALTAFYSQRAQSVKDEERDKKATKEQLHAKSRSELLLCGGPRQW